MHRASTVIVSKSAGVHLWPTDADCVLPVQVSATQQRSRYSPVPSPVLEWPTMVALAFATLHAQFPGLRNDRGNGGLVRVLWSMTSKATQLKRLEITADRGRAPARQELDAPWIG